MSACDAYDVLYSMRHVEGSGYNITCLMACLSVPQTWGGILAIFRMYKASPRHTFKGACTIVGITDLVVCTLLPIYRRGCADGCRGFDTSSTEIALHMFSGWTIMCGQASTPMQRCWDGRHSLSARQPNACAPPRKQHEFEHIRSPHLIGSTGCS